MHDSSGWHTIVHGEDAICVEGDGVDSLLGDLCRRWRRIFGGRVSRQRAAPAAERPWAAALRLHLHRPDACRDPNKTEQDGAPSTGAGAHDAQSFLPCIAHRKRIPKQIGCKTHIFSVDSRMCL